MAKLVFAVLVLLLLIWSMKRGFHNGMMKEVATLLSGVVSLACVALILIAVTSAMAKAMSTLTLCIIGLILLGIVFKLCDLIFKPILALSHVAVIGSFDKFLGALMGAVEAGVLSLVVFYILKYAGIPIL